ncbi:GNAT family N-acetyltransferase [bacterium]|jgi:predicted acetyltransferase|nr:GNAT family N-acetyltransferase [bacterium]MBT6832370.1 GNAT family N-acetyltransferase [bacterium]MBT6995915.1 GNAT family N-acetyltransferase [bacterium]MBT7772776.1 GNAT family N-acetyltransferase [bacterium]
MELVFPSSKYRESFLAAQQEAHDFAAARFTSREKRFIASEDFDAHVQKLEDYREGKNLPPGWAPATTWWLVDGDEWLGKLNFRHRLTPNLEKLGGHIGYLVRASRRGEGFGTKMLELALAKIKKIGLKKVLITCDDKNFASAKIIEKCGGILENIVPRADEEIEHVGAGMTRRYWISL